MVIGGIPLARRDNLLVPETLEHGGWSMNKRPREEFANWKRWIKSKRVPVWIGERPHMRPAFNKVKEEHLPRFLAKCIVP